MQTAVRDVGETTTSKKTAPVRYAFSYCRAEITKKQYKKRLKWFFDFVGLESGTDLEQQGQSFLDNARADSDYAMQQIMFYSDYHKQRVLRKEISSATLRSFLMPIRTFTNAYKDIAANIDWKRIFRAMPKAKGYASDRIPTIEELRRVVEYPDRRIKAIIYTMASSGIRIGAWDYLKWKHIEAIKNEKIGEIQAAKIVVYAEENEEYFSFITPEAYNALKTWMDFRARYGEQISGESWVMRDLFAVADIRREKRQESGASMKGGNTGRLLQPEQLKAGAIRRMLVKAFYEEGIRENLTGTGVRRHEFKSAHSLRKYFKTKAEQVMNRLNVEWLMGHSIGLNSNYYRPTYQELLTDYLRAVPSLMIHGDVSTIERQQEALEKREQEKEQEIELLKAEQAKMMQMMKAITSMLAKNGQVMASEDVDMLQIIQAADTERRQEEEEEEKHAS